MIEYSQSDNVGVWIAWTKSKERTGTLSGWWLTYGGQSNFFGIGEFEISDYATSMRFVGSHDFKEVHFENGAPYVKSISLANQLILEAMVRRASKIRKNNKSKLTKLARSVVRL